MQNNVLQFKEGRKIKASVYRGKNGKAWHCFMPITRCGGVGAEYDSCAEAVRRTLEFLDSLASDGVATYNGGDADALKYVEMLESHKEVS